MISPPKLSKAARLRQFLDDVDYWRANGTWPPDELAVRLHHGLVLIHSFTNGNVSS